MIWNDVMNQNFERGREPIQLCQHIVVYNWDFSSQAIVYLSREWATVQLGYSECK